MTQKERSWKRTDGEPGQLWVFRENVVKQIAAAQLYSLRNHVDIADLIQTLRIPADRRGSRVNFRCPDCARFHTAVRRERNLAYCFPCARSFNTIDLVMAERGRTFLHAVEFLECHLR